MATAQEHPGIPLSAGEAYGTALTSGSGFDWAFTFLCTLLTGGVFLDGWAHSHGKVDQSFFTPWHAILYSGYVLVALCLAFTLVQHHAKGAPWRSAYPAGYGSSVIGAAIFAVGGVGDLIWHTLFGIEKGIEGEISPSHLTLALGATLILTGPLRSIWLRTSSETPQRWRTVAPALLSLTYIFSLIGFFTQFANPIVHSRADVDVTQAVLILNPFDTITETDLNIKMGIASILLQTAIMMGIVLFAVRRWRLPAGSFAVIFCINGLLISVLAGSTPIIEVGILSALIGVLVDLLNVTLRPSTERLLALRVFAFAVPFINYAIYFAVLFALKGSIAWSIHLWTGSIVMAGVIGLLLSYLMVPPKIASA
jgi:hypothetical protein